MKRIECSAIVVLAALALAAAACGQPLTTAEQTQTAVALASPVSNVTALVSTTPGATTVTATVTAQATPPSPPQTLAPATPAPITPVVTGPAVRTDCPPQWITFESIGGRISICSPADLTATTSVDEAGSSGILLSADDPTGVAKPGVSRVLVAAQVSVAPTFNPNVSLTSVCAAGAPGGETVDLLLGTYRATGCHLTLEKDSPDGPLESLMLVAPLAPSFFLNMTVNWRAASPGAHDLAIQIAGTLSVTP